MKRLLCIPFLLLAVRGYGAAGDITGVTIETNGWVAEVTISSIATNGAFNWGFSDAAYRGTSKVVFTVTSAGFNDSGVSNAVTRTIYGTKQLRLPYPNNAQTDIALSGSDSVVRIALSEYLFSNCTATVSIAANWYSNNNAVANLAVVNNSTNTHPKVIANWSQPGFQRITNNTMTLSAVAFHRSAENGRPVRAMEFVATGATSGLSVTNWQLRPVATFEPTSGVFVVEYIGTLDVSGMTQGELMRCDFTAFPWIGDTNAITSTFDGAHTWPTPLYAPQTNLCDRLQTYGVTRAIVDPVNGNDTTGIAAVESYWATNSNPAPFLTIKKAGIAIAATNLARHARNDIGGSETYLVAGNNYVFAGTTGTAGTNAPTWAIIKPLAGAYCVITNTVGHKYVMDKMKLQGVVITNSVLTIFDSQYNNWFDSCVFASTGGATIYQVTNWCATSCTFSNYTQGIRPYSTVNSAPSLIRGCRLGLMGQSCFIYTALGNVNINTNNNSSFVFFDEIASSQSPRADGQIFAFNDMRGMSGSASTLKYFAMTNQPFGAAIVQNIFEWCPTTDQAVLQLCADGNLVTNCSNLIFWNNTIVGQRLNAGYNETVAAPFYHYFWSKKNNCLDDDNVKTDTFNDSVYHQQAVRIGNWTDVWGVGSAGNFLGNVTNIGPSGFTHYDAGGMAGLNTVHTNVVLVLNYQAYVDRRAYNGSAAGSGFGNYRLTSSSPLANWGCEWLLPYDIEGNARGGFDPPGAYASASPRKGGMFFAQ